MIQLTEFKNPGKEMRKLKSQITIVLVLLAACTFAMTGCSDDGINSPHLLSAGKNGSVKTTDATLTDSTRIKLDINFEFKSKPMKDTKFLESNEGYRFNRIIEIDTALKPEQLLDLQELQPYGIFSLYLSATGKFLLSNSDFSFTSRSLMMEKCELIDLKLKNCEQNPIHVTGFVAGE